MTDSTIKDIVKEIGSSSDRIVKARKLGKKYLVSPYTILNIYYKYRKDAKYTTE